MEIIDQTVKGLETGTRSLKFIQQVNSLLVSTEYLQNQATCEKATNLRSFFNTDQYLRELGCFHDIVFKYIFPLINCI